MRYEIGVEGILDPRWSAWFDGPQIDTEGDDSHRDRRAARRSSGAEWPAGERDDLGMGLISVSRTSEGDAGPLIGGAGRRRAISPTTAPEEEATR